MVNQNDNTWQYLLEQYLTNVISKEELEQLLQKADRAEDAETFTSELNKYWEKAKQAGIDPKINWDAKFENMMQETKRMVPVVPSSVAWKDRFFFRFVAAAIIILLAGTGIFFLFMKGEDLHTAATLAKRYANDIKPGSTGAVLTLSNGQKIVLDSARNGTLAVQGKTKIIYRDGRTIYDEGTGIAVAEMYNTMTTPKGRQYQLELADGSKVWLNAASSIRYPVTFTGKNREVDITGEAYFEITPVNRQGSSERIPFIVKVNGMKVEVLGTHFNINSYNDEDAVQTTLLEGKVKVTTGSMESILKPGQQAMLYKAGNMKVANEVDTDAVMAWKNGFFSFEHTDMETLMRQLERWYDVDIVYAGMVPDRKFGGSISRNSHLSDVLKILEESKVYFRIEGKKIIVLP